MMIRFLLRLAASLILLFAACIGLIHSPPYDDNQLSTFLTPPDSCPMPCFMGIRPGVTTVEEAIIILEAHEWVSAVDVNFYTDGSATISWAWNGRQSKYIDDDRDAYLGVSPSRVVTAMDIYTQFTFGDFLLWRPPDQGGLYCGAGAAVPFGPELRGIFADYEDQLEITAVIPSPDSASSYCPVMGGFCSLTIHDFYALPVVVRLGQSYVPRINFAAFFEGLGCNYFEYVGQ
jgi:hypothetical protein